MIALPEEMIGRGNERACYFHPEDNSKAIKVSYEREKGRSKQSDIEIKYYKQLLKRKKMDWTHLPKFYGEVETDQGKGFVIEVVKDYDGNVSKSFKYYIEKNGVEVYRKELEAYKQYFLDYLVIFNYGMMPKNILRRRTDENSAELVLIDGLGDVSFFTFPSKIPHFARKKIMRRWEKFEKKYLSERKS
ncbi:MAG: hypothetical protein J7L21_00945 [Sulfurimonas sp.]|nr:hypothetical protein [Sulfurimonas sp.]